VIEIRAISKEAKITLGESIKYASDLKVELIILSNTARRDQLQWNLYELVKDKDYTVNQLKDGVRKYKKRNLSIADLWDKLNDVLKSNALRIGVASRNGMFIQYCLKSIYKMDEESALMETDDKNSDKLIVKMPDNAKPTGLLLEKRAV